MILPVNKAHRHPCGRARSQDGKLINFMTLAKLQKAYDFTFEIEAKKNNGDLKEKAERAVKLVQLKPKINLHGRRSDLKFNYDPIINIQDNVKAKAL